MYTTCLQAILGEMMSPMHHNCVFWPPAKTSFLSGLGKPSAQAIIKDIDKGRVLGMSYRIDGECVYLRDKPRTLYFISIDGWDYSIKNDSHEYPILSFSYLDMGQAQGPLDKKVQNVRVLSRPLSRGYRIADKTLRVADYLMHRIAVGQVPNAQRVLASYKLLPTHPMVPGFFQESFALAQSFMKEQN